MEFPLGRGRCTLGLVLTGKQIKLNREVFLFWICIFFVNVLLFSLLPPLPPPPPHFSSLLSSQFQPFVWGVVFCFCFCFLEGEAGLGNGSLNNPFLFPKF